MKISGLNNQKRFTPDMRLEDNQRLSMLGLDAVILHTPRHSKGSISILTDDGNLFCGDFMGRIKIQRKPH